MIRISEFDKLELKHQNLDFTSLLASERSERDTLSSVQLRITDIYIYYILYIVRAIFVLKTRKEGGA